MICAATRNIRLRRVICLWASWGSYHITAREAGNITFCRRQNISRCEVTYHWYSPSARDIGFAGDIRLTASDIGSAGDIRLAASDIGFASDMRLA